LDNGVVAVVAVAGVVGVAGVGGVVGVVGSFNMAGSSQGSCGRLGNSTRVEGNVGTVVNAGNSAGKALEGGTHDALANIRAELVAVRNCVAEILARLKNNEHALSL
jgi:hypothetical protein